jgi:hypothetical protein
LLGEPVDSQEHILFNSGYLHSLTSSSTTFFTVGFFTSVVVVAMNGSVLVAVVVAVEDELLGSSALCIGPSVMIATNKSSFCSFFIKRVLLPDT